MNILKFSSSVINWTETDFIGAMQHWNLSVASRSHEIHQNLAKKVFFFFLRKCLLFFYEFWMTHHFSAINSKKIIFLSKYSSTQNDEKKITNLTNLRCIAAITWILISLIALDFLLKLDLSTTLRKFFTTPSGKRVWIIQQQKYKKKLGKIEPIWMFILLNAHILIPHIFKTLDNVWCIP